MTTISSATDTPTHVQERDLGTKYASQKIVNLVTSYTSAGWKFSMSDEYYEFKSPNGRFIKRYTVDGTLVKLIKKTRSR